MERFFSWVRFFILLILISVIIIASSFAYGLGYGYGCSIWNESQVKVNE